MTLPEMGVGGDPTRVTGRRAVGAIIEVFIDWFALFWFVDLAGINLRSVAGSQTDEVAAKLAVAYVYYLIYIVVTKVVTLGLFGWTPGMLCVAVRCVRWNGKPPGVLRALWRTFVFNVWVMIGLAIWIVAPLAGTAGGLGMISLLGFCASMSKGHRSVHDFAAGTYVVDSIYYGRMILVQHDGVRVGPAAVTREEAAKLLREQGVNPAAVMTFEPPGAKTGEPFMDKNLGTYVVWNQKENAWLAFDKSNGGWNRVG